MPVLEDRTGKDRESGESPEQTCYRIRGACFHDATGETWEGESKVLILESGDLPRTKESSFFGLI